MTYQDKIAKELGIDTKQVAATIKLLDEGATVPFISRYRKEVTGSLDDVQVTTIRDRVIQLRDKGVAPGSCFLVVWHTDAGNHLIGADRSSLTDCPRDNDRPHGYPFGNAISRCW